MNSLYKNTRQLHPSHATFPVILSKGLQQTLLVLRLVLVVLVGVFAPHVQPRVVHVRGPMIAEHALDPFPRMHVLVPLQVHVGRECLVAPRALESLLLVCQHVRSQVKYQRIAHGAGPLLLCIRVAVLDVDLEAETELAADPTLFRLPVRVDFGVPVEHASVGEPLPAHLAHQRRIPLLHLRVVLVQVRLVQTEPTDTREHIPTERAGDLPPHLAAIDLGRCYFFC